MNQNLIFGIFFFLNIIWVLACNFVIFVQTFQWTLSEFFLIFYFSSRKSKAQQKMAEKFTHLTMQFCSKNLTHFMNLNSLDIKNLSHFTNFLANIFLFGVRKDICTASFLDAQKLQSWSTFEKKCLYISVYLLMKKFLFQRRSKI